MKKVTFFIIFLFLMLAPLKTFAVTNNNEINLTTSPGYVLFDLSNVKPGDSVYRDLVIKNNGSQDFKYITSSKFLSGSEVFFDKLDLIVSDKNGTIYNGKLFEFNKLAPRLLKSKQNEKLSFYIKVPMELGNEFQGLSIDFQFKFYVDGTLGGLLPANGPALPNTGTNMYNILASGIVLILVGIFLQMFAKYKGIKNKQL
jgi:LPXTG-motif cell wall-anchored protein